VENRARGREPEVCKAAETFHPALSLVHDTEAPEDAPSSHHPQRAHMASVTRQLARRRVAWPQPSRHVRRFHDGVANPLNRVQIYTSRCTDPWINLSIEHFLLQRSAPDSTVLFLYTNRPCVVVGRNQNPWLEVNLGLVNRPGVLAPSSSDADDDDGTVSLVRRRSGGGTVFHDAGNVNYCVICPPAVFDRDRHAEMVVRALRGLSSDSGVIAARVNERHDIVLDVAGGGDGEGAAAGSAVEGAPGSTFKISGSAYKLTRLRSLHHGTCLLNSPNLHGIGRFLRSPAAPFIMARGVESFRSKITNVGIQDGAFREAVIAEFGDMYENAEVVSIGAEEAMSVPEIFKGHNEIRVGSPS
jgi:lipoate---protein ligase